MTDQTETQAAPGSDDDIARFLTEEERAAIAAADAEDEEAATDTTADEAAGNPGEPPAAAGKEEQATGTAPGEATADDRPDDREAADVRDGGPARAPLLQRPDTTADVGRLQAIPAEREAICDRYELGDLDARAMRAELARLDDEAMQARLRIERASIAEEMAAAAWRRSVEDFVRENPIVAKNALTWGAFDQAVRTVTGDKASAGLSDRVQLQRAFGLFSETFGLQSSAGKAAAHAGRAVQPEKPAPHQEKPAREVPPTLGSVPAAATTDADDGRFSSLDRLADRDPLAFEQAFARLNAADRAAYLAS